MVNVLFGEDITKEDGKKIPGHACAIIILSFFVRKRKTFIQNQKRKK